MGYFDEALKDYRVGIRKFDDRSSLYNRAIIQIERGNIQEALSDLNAAIKLDGYKDRNLLNNRAIAYAIGGEWSKARDDLTAALEVNENSLQSLFNRGLVYEVTGEQTLARADYERALRVSPNFTKAERKLDLILRPD